MHTNTRTQICVAYTESITFLTHDKILNSFVLGFYLNHFGFSLGFTFDMQRQRHELFSIDVSLSLLIQEFVWTVCEGADRNTSGDWIQKTIHIWAWHSLLPPKSPVSDVPSLVHCLSASLSVLCQTSTKANFCILLLPCLDIWKFLIKK